MKNYSRFGILVAASASGFMAASPSFAQSATPIPGTIPHDFYADATTIEYIGHDGAGTGTDLRCAWTIDAAGKAQLAPYYQRSSRNDSSQSVDQTWFLDDTIVVVKGTDLRGDATTIGVLTEVFRAKDKAVTKQCELDTNTNTFSQCRPAASFTNEAKARKDDGDIKEYCQNLFNVAYTLDGKPLGEVVDAADYKDPTYKDPVKEKAFYDHVRSQLGKLAGP